MAIFGAPVLIVALIMYFGFSRKSCNASHDSDAGGEGQPIPATLLAPPAPQFVHGLTAPRDRSCDGRRRINGCFGA